ncbi:MAG: dynamin family protein [Gammaproteobacteria bacterium]|nr:MAG: dynamin family protein [Gammaproteobacteria bacterium]RKZ43104.1 MAG: dynamin family protein [Gammaproteobacteria bacterium]RKZ77353.1 MAG: dynamin family protein [Gammaproteobacteria bacterium]
MPQTQLEARINTLKQHLKEENDILYEVVESFRELDKIAYKLGFLSQEQSYATRLSWWPMISVLGLYSAGKSTFINHYLGQELQRTGTQAVDDKFTVICYSGDEAVKILPGIALDADPRFPFYQISRDIAEITTKTGQRTDAYLQLKTCSSEQLRGKILIDSPGFDADNQRNSTLHIAQHIIDLSDLVMVFFDARHPEPGAMRDTLTHLVSETIERPDSNKFMYILNQMDITARDDNPEEVVASWQRSLAQAGLTAGRFYRVYSPEVCLPIEDPKTRERIDKKCQADLEEIQNRMKQVGVERAYRVIGILENTAKDIEHHIVPRLRNLVQSWKSQVFWTEMVLGVFIVVLAASWFGMTSISLKVFDLQNPVNLWIFGGVLITVSAFLHLKICKWAANSILKKLQCEKEINEDTREGLMRAFRKNTTSPRALFIGLINEPVGWGNRMHKRIGNILGNVNSYVQKLNDQFTNPSGKATDKPASSPKTEEDAPATVA